LIKKKVLRESRLVFSTLSAAGSGILESSEIEFDTVVIDEAGQAVELSCLIPLMYSCKRLILIGDPKQLPATVFSPVCLKCHYDQSLFERLMRSEYPVSMLKIQYRMHPDISEVIGNVFYQGLLENGNQMVV
jgi:senataxin